MRQSKRFTALALALALVLSLTTGASAAQPKAEQVAASISYNITVEFNGEAKALSNVNGQQVYPVLYGGTTYVPIRAIGYLLGLKVDWDQATRTVLLDKPSYNEAAEIKTAKPDSPKKTGTEAIRPTIDPGITVKYNGEAQTMKTATGATVYPMIDGGTTYLPIRAVSNMLGLEVDWEQSTQTVKLTSGAKTVIVTSKGSITIDLNDAINNDWLAIDDDLAAIGIAVNSDEYNDIIGKILLKVYEYEQSLFETANDTVVTNTGASNQYLAVDWSTASKGYINVKMKDSTHEKLGSKFSIAWTNEKGQARSEVYELFPGQEYDIPLEGGSTEYAVSFTGTNWLVCQHLMPEDAGSYQKIHSIAARFTAKIDDPDSRWLLSVPHADFKNAPNACAKALELMKNCKTDAEKITVIFNWVSQNIKYNQAMYNRHKTTHEIFEPTCISSTPNPNRHWDATVDDNLGTDRILAAKSGVCQHYAALMAAMLRSLGVECKYVSGNVYSDEAKGWSEPHAWVAVKPKTGELDMAALGAGKDQDRSLAGADGIKSTDTGWIRLDPTWGGTASGRANASVDNTYWANNRY